MKSEEPERVAKVKAGDEQLVDGKGIYVEKFCKEVEDSNKPNMKMVDGKKETEEGKESFDNGEEPSGPGRQSKASMWEFFKRGKKKARQETKDSV